MEIDDAKLNGITEKIIGAAFTVRKTLGIGFLEKVYENALAHELRLMGLEVKQQVAVTVLYRGVGVGDYVADLLVEDLVIVELKAIKAFEQIHTAQCLNYLKATGKPVALLLNFASQVEVKRLRL